MGANGPGPEPEDGRKEEHDCGFDQNVVDVKDVVKIPEKQVDGNGGDGVRTVLASAIIGTFDAGEMP